MAKKKIVDEVQVKIKTGYMDDWLPQLSDEERIKRFPRSPPLTMKQLMLQKNQNPKQYNGTKEN